MNGIWVSDRISSKMGETSNAKPTTRCARPLGDGTQTRAVCDHELHVETEVPEWLQPFTEIGRINNGSSSKRRCNFIHPKQLSPFPERLELPYPKGEIQSGYEEDVSFIQDWFATWVKADPNVTLERHMVDVRNAFAEYREASVRRQEAPAREYFFDNSVPNRSSVQNRLSMYNWNPGLRRGKTGRYRKTNCRKEAYYHFAGGG